MLEASPLLTLTGPAWRRARRGSASGWRGCSLDRFDDGAWLVELRLAHRPRLRAAVGVGTLGITEPAGRSLLAAIVDHLRKARRLLLVLDNCEHLLDACAELAEALLRACPAA